MLDNEEIYTINIYKGMTLYKRYTSKRNRLLFSITINSDTYREVKIVALREGLRTSIATTRIKILKDENTGLGLDII